MDMENEKLMLCPKCKGTGKLLSAEGVPGEGDCNYCNHKGFVTLTEYNNLVNDPSLVKIVEDE